MVRTKMTQSVKRHSYGDHLTTSQIIAKKKAETRFKNVTTGTENRKISVQRAKAVDMYIKLSANCDFALKDAGWIYCRSDGKCDGEYKCGFTKQGKTRQEAEQKLFERLRTDIRNPRIYHMVPVSNAPMSEKILFAWLSDYRVEREFFKVDDVSIIINEMNKLPF